MDNKAVKNLIEICSLVDGKRIFTTNKEYIRFLRPKRRTDYKPFGLWYSIGSSWIEWCLGEEFDGIGKYIYEVELNPRANILFLKTKESVHEFSRKYKRVDEPYTKFSSVFIDWAKVMEDYDGIEVNPYFYNLRFSMGFIWYYGWDVPSGCIWKAIGKKKITLIAEYNAKKKEFVLL